MIAESTSMVDLPHSIQAEQAVLGSLMMDNSSYQRIAAITKPEHFYNPAHKEIFFAIRMTLAMYNAADIVTLSTYLKNENKLEKIGGVSFLMMLDENTPTSANIGAYAQILADKYEARKLLELSTKVHDLISSDPHNGSKQARKEIEKVANKNHVSHKKLFTPLGELLKNRTCVNWLIRDYLPTKSTCMIYGESGAGKSFLMLDMALCIATGRRWNGIKTKQTPVFYIAGEGQSGITSRCLSWGIYHGVDIDVLPFYITDQAVVPSNEDELNDLISNVSALIEATEAQNPLIIFDTLSRCFDGDENKSQDANRYIKAIDKLRHRFDACIVSVHHSGKDASKGARGSTAFKGAWDAEHQLTVDLNKTIKLQPTKIKERELPLPTYYRLHGVETNWLDEDGEIVRSAVILPEHDVMPSESHEKTPRLDVTSQNILTALHKAIDEKGIATPDFVKAMFDPECSGTPPTKVIRIDDFRSYAYPYFDCAENSKRVALSRVVKKLEKMGKTMFYNDCLWVC